MDDRKFNKVRQEVKQTIFNLHFFCLTQFSVDLCPWGLTMTVLSSKLNKDIMCNVRNILFYIVYVLICKNQ